MVRGKLVFAREWCDSPNGKICISTNLPKKATESTKVNGQRRWPYACMETTQNLDGSRKATTGRKKIDGIILSQTRIHWQAQKTKLKCTSSCKCDRIEWEMPTDYDHFNPYSFWTYETRLIQRCRKEEAVEGTTIPSSSVLSSPTSHYMKCHTSISIPFSSFRPRGVARVAQRSRYIWDSDYLHAHELEGVLDSISFNKLLTTFTNRFYHRRAGQLCVVRWLFSITS